MSAHPARPLECDVIVVGAGTAGCVVAGRLATAGVKVLLLEAGVDAADPASVDPARMHELWDSPADWGYRTAPQAHAHDRRLHLPRGKIVGGSHALNAMIWVRGNPADYDNWAYAGNPGWAWRDVLPVFQRIEAFDVESGTRGMNGVQPVLSAYEPTPLHTAIVAAAQQAGLPFNADYNGSSQDGVSFMQFTISDKARSTTADAYLRAARARTNLTVIGDAVVHRLLFSGRRCVGVEWERAGAVRQTRATETVLCAGAIGSPTILLRSGVGSPDELDDVGIHSHVDLPGVGRNLQDHWLCPVIFATARPDTPRPGLPLTQSHLFWRSRADLLVPDLQPLHFAVPLYEPWMEGPPTGFSLMAGLVRPASRGTVTLSRFQPHDAPLIDPQVLAQPADAAALAAAVRLCQEIGKQPALRRDWGAQELYPSSLGESDALLDAYIRESVITYHHQSGTCQMGVGDDAVVDPELRVHGVEGLRVADASIMPTITTGNTNAPVVLIGEKAAAFVARALNVQPNDASQPVPGSTPAQQLDVVR